ncbi:MAG: hypothetical protein AAFO61_11440 [Pseudomonadota bacterium]
MILEWITALADTHLVSADDLAHAERLLSDARVRQDGAAILALAQDIAEAADADALARDLAEPPTGEVEAETVMMATLAAAMEVMAVANRNLDDKDAAIAARTELAVKADGLYGPLGTFFGADVLAWFMGVVGTGLRLLSNRVATLAPLVRVETSFPVSATVLAWRLYGNPSRGRELVQRNRVATPAIMPTQLVARAI